MDLLCTVRDCGGTLTLGERAATCPRKHSYDRARSGYFNLLQPQDRRSATPGDTTEAVDARRRLLERGLARPELAAMIELLRPFHGPLVDVGCGEGWFTDGLRAALGVETCGVDLSQPAIERAARRYPDVLWVIANADRLVPVADHAVSIVTSITARLQPDEFWRALTRDGVALVVLTAADDLVELRTVAGGEAVQRDRVGRTVEEFKPAFELLKAERATHRETLDQGAIDDVMTSAYRGLRARERERLSVLGGAEVTLSRDILLFRPRRKS